MSRQPLDVEREVDGVLVRAGDVVKIEGIPRARTPIESRLVPGFRVLGFRGDDVECFGAKSPKLAPALRTFTLDRVRVPKRPKRRARAASI